MLLPYLLKNADYTGLLKFVSPNFFQVVSASTLLRNGTRLMRNRADTEAWKTISQRPQQGPGDGPGSVRDADVGRRALAIFFHQIFAQTTWVLDFRSQAFRTTESGTHWSPEPFFYEVSNDFARAVRSLYKGFYLSDDQQFEGALAALNIAPARETLRTHFGSGDQTHVRFDLKHFQATFAEVFATCAREKRELHPEFFVLGLSLLCLYQNLETQGRAYDVRGAFLRALAESELK